jgi:translation initiation factor 1
MVWQLSPLSPSSLLNDFAGLFLAQILPFLLINTAMKKSGSNDNPVVYSSEFGRMCPACGKPANACICSKNSATPAGDGVVRIRRESKGRGGKTVMVITGLPLDADALTTLAGELKRRCGCGGTAKDGSIEIQGDHGELLLAELAKRGYKAKRAGG